MAAPIAPDIAARQALARALLVDTMGLTTAVDAAQATADNARQMVLNRDSKLNKAAADAADAQSNYAALLALAQNVQTLSEASTADRAGLHAAVDSLRADLTAEAASRKAADDALTVRVATLEATVAALQALKVTVGFGVANLPTSLAAGATTNIVVTLSRNMGSATYSVGYGLAGGTSLLGQLTPTGVTAQTATTVTIGVRNTGLTALLNLSTASLSVVAARDT